MGLGAGVANPSGDVPDFEYEVALSFASEDRVHAEGLAQRLSAADVRVFYDAYEKATLWGKDLYVHLSDIYSRRARFCVIFASRHYAARLWTNHERQAAQSRALQEKGREYILPIRIDDTEIPGLVDTVGYVSIHDGIVAIAETLLQKLRGSSAIDPVRKPRPRAPPRPRPLTRKQQATTAGAVVVALLVLLIARARITSHPEVHDDVTVAGVIVDAASRPIRGAVVTIEGRDFYAQSGGDGAFRGSLRRVRHELILTVKVSAPGHPQESRQVTVSGGSLNLHTVMLD